MFVATGKRHSIAIGLAGAVSLSGAMAQTVTLTATEFPKLTEGPADFYVDAKNKALAIDASNEAFRNKWAIAEMAFPGQSGTYDIAFFSMFESDGESRYALRIGNDSVGGFQNPSAYTGTRLTTPDYTLHRHTFRGVAVAKGAAVKVYGMTHSNGKVPEKGGFAWSRGRWGRLEFSPGTPSTLVARPLRTGPRTVFSRDAVTLAGLTSGRQELRLTDAAGRTVFARVFEAGASGQATIPRSGAGRQASMRVHIHLLPAGF